MKNKMLKKIGIGITNLFKNYDNQSKELKLVFIGLIFAGIILIGIIATKPTSSDNYTDIVQIEKQSVSSTATVTKSRKIVDSSSNHPSIQPNKSIYQTKDISNSVRQYFSSEIAFFKGASVDGKNEIHITLVLNEQSYKWSIAAVEMFGVTETYEGLRLENALKCIFKPARNIFKKVPSAKAINVYMVTLEDIRDSYGHKTSDDKTVHCQLSLTKETVARLDWSYINKLLGSYKQNDELKRYLDAYHFYTDYFNE